ncbi:Ulp1 family isopeptidase [Pseudochelatococcus sp. B33]
MSDVSYISGLTTAHLESLLNPTTPLDDKAISILHANAADGDADSIELLVNLAARPDKIGAEAENILFDLFSGKPDTDAGIHSIGPGVDTEIARQSLRLIEGFGRTLSLSAWGKATPVLSGDEDKGRAADVTSPPKLLYMAGAATQAGSEIHRKVVADIVGEARGVDSSADMDEAFPKKQPTSDEREDPWSKARFLSVPEVTTGLAAVAKQSPGTLACVEAAFGNGLLTNPANLLKAFGNGEKLLFVPLQHNSHWLSLVIYKDTNDDNKPKAVLFDSIGGYYEDRIAPDGAPKPGIKHQLVPALKGLGIAEKNIMRLEADLQGKAPNSCGVYTVEAFKRVAAAAPLGLSPSEALSDLIAGFAQKPDAQQRFNMEGRRQIHGALIDAVRQEQAEAAFEKSS